MSLRLWVMQATQPLVGRFPGVFYPAALGAGWMAYHLSWHRRRNLVRNMTPLVNGDSEAAQRAALRAFQNIASYYVDLCTLPYRRMERFEADHLEIVDGERLAALEDPGPVIAMSAHTGSAELAIQALTYRGRPFVALVEAQRPREWSRYLLRLRSAAGARFVEANFQGIRTCIEALQEGGVAGFMGDRDIQRNGHCVALACRRVRLPRGPWEIARRTDALVLPVFTSRIRHDRFRAYVEEPFRVARTDDEEADIEEAIGRFARVLERHLRRDPGQWAFTEDFWTVHACG